MEEDRIKDMKRVEEALGIKPGPEVGSDAYYHGFRDAVYSKSDENPDNKALLEFAKSLGERSDNPNEETIDDSEAEGPKNFEKFMRLNQGLSGRNLLIAIEKTYGRSIKNVSPNSVAGGIFDKAGVNETADGKRKVTKGSE